MKKRIHFVSYGDKYNNHIPSIQKVLDAGIDLVQLRIKGMEDMECREQVLEAKRLCELYNADFILNDRVQLAKVCGVSGVHLGQKDMSVTEARELLGDEATIGGTANSLDQMIKLAKEGVNYIGLGPYRFTETKKNLSPILGHEGIQEQLRGFATLNLEVPVYIIGGILETDFNRIKELPLKGIAVSSLFADRSSKEIEILKHSFEKSI
jgi:thiamine-phosphate pyrophosphorylase